MLRHDACSVWLVVEERGRNRVHTVRKSESSPRPRSSGLSGLFSALPDANAIVRVARIAARDGNIHARFEGRGRASWLRAQGTAAPHKEG